MATTKTKSAMVKVTMSFTVVSFEKVLVMWNMKFLPAMV